MGMKSKILMGILAVWMGGCAGSVSLDPIREENELAASRKAYDNCVRVYPRDPAKCADLKEAYMTRLNSARARDYERRGFFP